MDGSFKSSNNQSGSSVQSHEQLPDISGLDLAAGISNNSPGLNSNIETLPNTEPAMSDQDLHSENNANVALDLNFDTNNQSSNLQHADIRTDSDETGNNEPTSVNRDERLQVSSLLEQANSDKERLQKVTSTWKITFKLFYSFYVTFILIWLYIFICFQPF